MSRTYTRLTASLLAWLLMAIPALAGHTLIEVRDLVPTSLVVTNTVVETTIYSITIQGGTLSPSAVLRLQLRGTYLNNTSGPAISTTATYRVKWGGVTRLQFDATGMGASTNKRLAAIDVLIINLNSTSLQFLDGVLVMGQPAAEGSSIGLIEESTRMAYSSTAVDTTSAVVLEVTVQHGNANVNINFERKLAVLFG